MQKIFEFDDAVIYLKAHFKLLPQKGFGESAKIARALRVHPSLITGILNGKNQFTPDQASDLADYLGLDDLEADFLLLLVQWQRAGSPGLRKKLKRQIDKLRESSKKVKSRVGERAQISDEAKHIFYSQWYYSALRMLAQIIEVQSPDQFAQRLQLPVATVRQALDFLVETGLLVEGRKGFQLGPQKTHIASDDPFVIRHHLNWREKSLQHIQVLRDDELRFTGPLTISEKDMPKVREILLSAIQSCFKIVDPSPSETAACLLIDWFRF